MQLSRQFHIPAALLQAKSSRRPPDGDLGGNQGRSGPCGELRFLVRKEAPVFQPVTTRTHRTVPEDINIEMK